MTDTALSIPYIDDLPAAFAAPEKVDEIIASVQAQARAHVPDLTTALGRTAIASVAHKVARSKTALDEAGKDLTLEYRDAIGKVDAERRRIRDALDELKAEVRAPLTRWEQAEAARKAELARRLADINRNRPTAYSTPEQIAEMIARLEATPLDDSWQEEWPAAVRIQNDRLAECRTALEVARTRAAEQAELERLRREAAEQAAGQIRELVEAENDRRRQDFNRFEPGIDRMREASANVRAEIAAALAPIIERGLNGSRATTVSPLAVNIADAVVMALLEGKIPHVKVEL